MPGVPLFYLPRHLEEKSRKKARQVYHSALTLGCVSGVGITLVGVLICGPIAGFLGKGGALSENVYAYCLVSFLGTIPTILSYFPLFYLQLEGKVKSITNMIIIMISVDVFLDLIFLYVFELGLYGAAAASVLSILAVCIYGFYKLEEDDSNYRFSMKLLGIRETGRIIKTGSPIALGNFYDAIRLLLLNAMILAAGGTRAVAVWAVLNTMSELSLTIVSGVPQAAAPMTGVYYFARENSGIRILFKLQIQVGLLFSGIYAAALLLFHTGIENLFQIKENLLLPFLALSISIIWNVFESIWTSLMNETEKIMLANMFSAFRRILFPVVFVWGVIACDGYLWLFLPLGSFFAVAVGISVIFWCSARSGKTERPLSTFLLLDDSLERENKILDFSISANMEEACEASEKIKEFCSNNEMNTKQTIRMGLAIEELMNILIERSPETQSFDLRAYALQGVIGIQIRCAGKRFNPFEDLQEEDDLYMGVEMLRNLAQLVKHTYALGMNTINICF